MLRQVEEQVDNLAEYLVSLSARIRTNEERLESGDQNRQIYAQYIDDLKELKWLNDIFDRKMELLKTLKN